jgi:hypothetical protein
VIRENPVRAGSVPTSTPPDVTGHTKAYAPELHSPREARRVSTHLDVISTFPCKPFIRLEISTIIPRVISWRLALAATCVHSCCSMKPYARLAGTPTARTSHGLRTIPSRPKVRGARKVIPWQICRCQFRGWLALPVRFFSHPEALSARNDGSGRRSLRL